MYWKTNITQSFSITVITISHSLKIAFISGPIYKLVFGNWCQHTRTSFTLLQILSVEPVVLDMLLSEYKLSIVFQRRVDE
jgi:hypothetical protein